MCKKCGTCDLPVGQKPVPLRYDGPSTLTPAEAAAGATFDQLTHWKAGELLVAFHEVLGLEVDPGDYFWNQIRGDVALTLVKNGYPFDPNHPAKMFIDSITPATVGGTLNLSGIAHMLGD